MPSEMIDRAVQIVKKMLEKNTSIDDIKTKLTGVGISNEDIVEILKIAGVGAPAAKEETAAEAAGETPSETLKTQESPAATETAAEAAAEPAPDAEPANRSAPSAPSRSRRTDTADLSPRSTR